MNGQAHVIKTVHGGGEVHVVYVNAYVLSTLYVEYTIPKDLGGDQVSSSDV